MREDEETGGEAARDALNARKTRSTVEKPGQALSTMDPTAEFAEAGAFGPTSTGPPLIARAPLPDERVDPAWLRRRIGACETFARYVTATR
jgi:hypothetical protein